MHHITEELLRGSFFELKKQAAPGIDGETWQDYAIDFERRIEDLHDRIHRGAYQAKPSKRTYVPKPAGGMRPLGIAALEDKIVQQAARTVLECIYDRIFKGTKPANLPVERPKKFEFIFNLRAAKQIGLTIPPNVLARADRVIR
jgi:hypothetical protein